MDEPQTPDPFRQTVESTNPDPDRFLTPIIIGLGVLLVVGGILLGVKNRKVKVADLPEYSPIMVTALPIVSPAPSPSYSEAASPSPVISMIPSSSISNAPSPATVVTTAVGRVLGTSTVRVPTSKPTATPPATPSSSSSASLPVYQPAASLPDYEPQFVTPSPAARLINVRLTVGGQQYSTSVQAGSTVFQTMEALKDQGLAYETKEFSFGTQIVSVNSQTQTTTDFWVYSINGVFATKGVSSQTVNEGDVIEWKLSKS